MSDTRSSQTTQKRNIPARRLQRPHSDQLATFRLRQILNAVELLASVLAEPAESGHNLHTGLPVHRAELAKHLVDGAVLCGDGEWTCKRDSVAVLTAGGHPSLRPTRKLSPEGRTGRPCFLLGLAPDGVYRAVGVTPGAGALLPHRFTLACDRKRSIGGLLSVALSRQVAPTWLSPASCPVESRLSSTRSNAMPRPPGPLTIAPPTLRGAAQQLIDS